MKFKVKAFFLTSGVYLMSQAGFAGSCCHTPTQWSIKNLDKIPVTLSCKLEKSSVWSGKPVLMTTGSIPAGGTYVHTWDKAWYSDGMGMIPGSWSCRSTAEAIENKETPAGILSFTTDWGENISISWNKAKGSLARSSKK